MKRALMKDIFRELRQTRSRFLSILIMVALASMFLCGLRSAAPDMQLTSDLYYDTQKLMDLRVISTLGLETDDVAALAAAEGVGYAEGAYTLDALVSNGESELLLRLHTLSDRVNVPVLLEGRLPERADECAVERQVLSQLGLSIGDSITFGGNEDLEDQLASRTCTITGVVRSPYYIGINRGTASLADGVVDGFVLLPRSAFTMDYYTEIYLLADGAEAHLCYDDAYEMQLDALTETVEPLAEAQIEQRYQDILSEAQTELDDAEAELNDAEAELASEESSARAELADARMDLDQGWRDYEDALVEFDQQIADAETELADAAAELESGRQLLAQNEQQLTYNRQQLLTQESEAETAFLAAEQTLADTRLQLDAAEQQYQEGVTAYEAANAQLPPLEERLAYLEDQYILMASRGEDISGLLVVIRQVQAQISGLSQQLEQASAELTATRTQLDAGWAEYNAGAEALAEQRAAAEIQFEDAWAQIWYAESQLSQARQTLEQGETDYNNGLAELETARIDGQQQLEDALAELEQGETDYADGLAELNAELADARDELDEGWLELEDAYAELQSVERGKLYLMDRTSIPNYVGYEQDSDRMSALGNVFPVLFFVVAGLVCLTTMTRMVEEQRTQIGVLKAVGYGTWPVAQKFLIYGSLAAVIGTVIGCILGTYFIPWVICSCYGIMYFLPPAELPWHWGVCIGVAAASLGCTLAAVLWAVWASIIRTPAELMRPKAPRAGKRILLERIGPLWRHLNFSTKVSARNLLRYKKRFWMTVIGVAGCTGLIVAGFGLQSGILSIIDRQFGDINRYDLQVTLDDTASASRRKETIDWLNTGDRAQYATEAHFASVTLHSDSRSEEGYLTVTAETESFLQQITLHDYTTGEPLTLPEEGCIITSKLSELLELSVGDEIVVEADQRVSIPITAICEHYVQHYVYLSATAYETAFGAAPELDTVLLTLPDTSDAAVSDFTTQLLEQPAVLAVTNIHTSAEEFENTMGVVNYVVVIIIAAAAVLAFVVLYNLTNINITERMRELATLKVLGFFDGELAMYVYRENFVLTLLGIALGQLFGAFLATYIIRTIEIDMVMFVRTAAPSSYVWSVVLSVVFALLVNLVMYFRLKKIDMVESLKSVE